MNVCKNLVMVITLVSISFHTLRTCELQCIVHADEVPKGIECLIGADIGGTNSRFGFFVQQEDQKSSLLFSLHTKTKTINNFNDLFFDVLAYAKTNYDISVKNVCIAAPGVTAKERDYSSAHGLFDIKSKKLKKKNNDLSTVLIVNDLLVVGYGLDSINQENVIKLYGDEPEKEALRAVIGIGTGLGSSTLHWNHEKKSYTAHPGEAGLLEFAPHNKFEYDLANHIRQMSDARAVYWAAFASGSGIRRIYSMLKLSKEYEDSLDLDVHDPAVIFAHPEDALCKATIDIFMELSARFIRNYAFALLPYGGIYLTGNIISNNKELIMSSTGEEYANCGSGLQQILQRIPLYMIADPTIGMHGAVNYLLQELKA